MSKDAKVCYESTDVNEQQMIFNLKMLNRGFDTNSGWANDE